MKKERFITLEEVLDRVCISRTHLYRLINGGQFPKQVPLGPYKIAFLESEVEDWITARLKARDMGEGEDLRRQRAQHSASQR